MKTPRERCPYAGCEMRTRPDVGKVPSGFDLGNRVFQVEDWCENVLGFPWMVADGNPAAMIYAFRIGMKFGTAAAVPLDNNVVYGKIDGLGYLLHVTELCLLEG